jgi:hypothetical protein
VRQAGSTPGNLFHKLVWHAAFKTAGLEYLKRADEMHALRHFYAPVLLAQLEF